MLSPGTLLVGAGLLGTLRWSVTALTTDLALLAAAQTLHAATFAATHLAAMHYISRSAPPRLAASMQTLYAALSGGLPLGGAMLPVRAQYTVEPGRADSHMSRPTPPRRA